MRSLILFLFCIICIPTKVMSQNIYIGQLIDSVTIKKETDKVYTRYTGYPGGQRFNTPEQLRKRNDGAERILRHAVKGMLPKGRLGRHILDNLYIFGGTEHNMQAQKPKAIDINQYK